MALSTSSCRRSLWPLGVGWVSGVKSRRSRRPMSRPWEGKERQWWSECSGGGELGQGRVAPRGPQATQKHARLGRRRERGHVGHWDTFYRLPELALDTTALLACLLDRPQLPSLPLLPLSQEESILIKVNHYFYASPGISQRKTKGPRCARLPIFQS